MPNSSSGLQRNWEFCAVWEAIRVACSMPHRTQLQSRQMRGIQQQQRQTCYQQQPASAAAAAHRLTPHRHAVGLVACSSRAKAALASPAAAATATNITAAETFVSREARAALFGSADEVGRPCKDHFCSDCEPHACSACVHLHQHSSILTAVPRLLRGWEAQAHIQP